MRSSISNDREDEMLYNDSPSVGDEAMNYEEPPRGGQAIALKKGPWTSVEDAILIEYVKKHGEGNWNAVQKQSGLSRCGKSCRLRWANHLRPNLKKGAFTLEEERLIMELHAKMGNKWALMAAHLPGRTDNEIKNYWNTRIKRRQRAGLPLYPPDLRMQALQKNQENISGAHGGDELYHDLFQTNSYGIPDHTFGSSIRGVLPCASDFQHVTGSLELYNSINPTLHCQKRLRQTGISQFSSSTAGEAPSLDKDKDSSCENNVSQNAGLYFPYDPDPLSNNQLNDGINLCYHSISKVNISTSVHLTGAMKSELPSFQYPETNLGGWVTPSSLHVLESVDSFIQSPPLDPLQSDNPSPQNSGLLDALIYQTIPHSTLKCQTSMKSTSSSATLGDAINNSALVTSSTEFEGCDDPISSLRNSTESIFSEWNPIAAAGSPLEENQSAETFPEFNVKLEEIEPNWDVDEERKETTIQSDGSRPDAILGSSWLDHSLSSSVRKQRIVSDSVIALLGDDLGSELKNMTAETSASSSGWGLTSCLL